MIPKAILEGFYVYSQMHKEKSELLLGSFLGELTNKDMLCFPASVPIQR